MDLYIWFDDEGDIIKLQLCYRLGTVENAFTWGFESGYSHDTVDDGDTPRQMLKQTPLLVADGEFNSVAVGMLFSEVGGRLEKQIFEFVRKKIAEYEKKTPEV